MVFILWGCKIGKDYYVNERIRIPEVRVVSDSGGQLGVYKTFDAVRLAREQGMDLILISPTANPPVAKIADFGKFKYQQTKHDKEARKSQHSTVVKEVKLSVKIGDHDLMVRVARTREFLEKKNKVKINLYFRGREVTHKEFGEKVINRLVELVADVGVPEGRSKMEGRSMVLLLVPKT